MRDVQSQNNATYIYCKSQIECGNIRKRKAKSFTHRPIADPIFLFNLFIWFVDSLSLFALYSRFLGEFGHPNLQDTQTYDRLSYRLRQLNFLIENLLF